MPGVNQTAADQYWGITGVPGMGNQGTREGFRGYRAAVGSAGYGGLAPTAVMPTGGGGGGYGGGRGGGGGGGSGLTQQMLDAMMQALGARGPQLTLQQANLPEFVGTPMAAFDATPYTQAAQQLAAARAADAAAINQAGTQATQALQKNYSNAYANTPVAAGPQAAPVGVGLQQTVGGGGNQQAVTDVNQAAAGDQASFQNLLNVLAAVDQSSQNSRLNEVALNTGTAQNALGAQARGLGAGINMAQAQARNQWGQAANEREYQNSLMHQQWARENMQRNQDIANQQAQGRWQQTNEMISSRLGPLLELLAGGNGLNTTGLQQLLQGWQR
ncbi:MAG TPA: hypothetical protein VFX15_00235 [Actinomycetes bacterium]|nr:hypothetical protein [Actinomycetes bacterium]